MGSDGPALGALTCWLFGQMHSVWSQGGPKRFAWGLGADLRIIETGTAAIEAVRIDPSLRFECRDRQRLPGFEYPLDGAWLARLDPCGRAMSPLRAAA